MSTPLMTDPRGSPRRRDRPRRCEDRLAREDRLVSWKPLLVYYALSIDEEEGAPRVLLVRCQHAVVPDRLQFREIAQQRVRQFEGVGKGLLRKEATGADAQDLDVEGLEFREVGLPGREIGRSRRPEVVDVELQEDELPAPELA